MQPYKSRKEQATVFSSDVECGTMTIYEAIKKAMICGAREERIRILSLMQDGKIDSIVELYGHVTEQPIEQVLGFRE